MTFIAMVAIMLPPLGAAVVVFRLGRQQKRECL